MAAPVGKFGGLDEASASPALANGYHDGFELKAVNDELRQATPLRRIQWAVDRFGESVVMLSSMQKTASILMHLFYSLGLNNEVLFVDTGYHFHETLKLRDEVMRRYKLNMVTLYPELTPEDQEKKFERKLYLFADGQPECCRLRKEDPFIGHMKSASRRVIVSGLRKAEGRKRGKVEALALDPRIGGYVVHPIFDFSDEQVDEYLKQHDVPVHPLHAQNYPSIGCACCTTPVAEGEDARAGRWRHLRPADAEGGPQYCGINFAEGSGI